MREQWRGASVMAMLLIPTVGALVTWIFLQQRSRVDDIEAQLRLLQPELEAIRRDCQHVSPARMLKIDTTDNEHSRKIDQIEHEILSIKKKLKRR